MPELACSSEKKFDSAQNEVLQQKSDSEDLSTTAEEFHST